jgi:hypothetical protein
MHKIYKTHSINIWKKKCKNTSQFFFNSAFFNVYRKKLGQFCQNYDVINIFSKWEATIRIRLFDRAYFNLV